MSSEAPAIHVDISVSDPQWKDIPDFETLSLTVAKKVLDSAMLPRQIEKKKALEVSVLLANDALIQVLNREHRKIDRPTNVLSFAFLDEPGAMNGDTVALGDVVLSYETIEREAREQGKFIRDHALHMLVHGTLHLLGYDHQNNDDATVMETLEIRVLESLGIQNPYTERAVLP